MTDRKAHGDRTTCICEWCGEWVPERKDGSLMVHFWEVAWDRERDRPTMGRCVGSRTSVADALEAMR